MWSNTHKPRSWQNFVGNAGALQQCKQWLTDFCGGKNVPRVLVISGPEGCGKSVAAELLLKKAGFKDYTFSVNEIKNHRNDKNRLDNFCNLYVADLRKLGAAKSRIQAHGMIVEDFDSLARNDKAFTGAIIDLIKTRPSTVTPLIVTTDDSRTHKISSSLLRISRHIAFERLLEKDLVRIAMRVAADERVYLNMDAAEVFAEHAYGDARQLLSHMEMFYVGRAQNTPVDVDDVIMFLDRNKSDNDRKQCKAFEGDLSSKQTEDERILGAAIGDRGDNRRDYEKEAALRIASDSSIQFAPLLFQAYPQAIPYRADRFKEAMASMETAAEVADYFSFADMIKELSWGEDSHYDLFSSFSIVAPVTLLRRSRQDDASKHFTVSAKGYQTFYGSENTANNQTKLMRTLRSGCSSTFGLTMFDLGYVKHLFAHALETQSDEEIVDMLFTENSRFRMHPDMLETLGKISGGTCTTLLSLTRARKKRLVKLYEAREEKAAPTVKFIEPEPEMRSKKKKKNNKTETTDDNSSNDIFTLNW